MKGVKCRKLSYLFGLVCLLSVSICLSVSSSVSAFEFQDGIAFDITSASGTANTGTVNFVHTNNDWAGYFTGNTLTGLNFNFEPWQSSATIPNQYLITFNVTYTSTLGNNVTTGGHYRYNGLQSSNMQLVFESCVDRTNGAVFNGGVVQYIGEGIAQCTYIFYSAADYNYFNSISNSRIFYGESATDSQVIITPGFIRAISWNGLTQDDRDWLEDVLGSSADVSSVVSTINSQTTTLNNSINNLRSDTQAQTDAIEQGNDDAQSRWEADKQEESDREEAGQDDADAMLSIFDFNLTNPFAPIFDSFTNQQCVNIPTIAGWLHLDNSQYCSWWSQSIRDILTPVFGMFSTMLLFGFIIHWLRDGSGSQIPTGEKGIVYKPHF